MLKKWFLKWNIIYLALKCSLFDFLFLLYSLFISWFTSFWIRCYFDGFLWRNSIIRCNFILFRLFMLQIRFWISTFSIASRFTETLLANVFAWEKLTELSFSKLDQYSMQLFLLEHLSFSHDAKPSFHNISILLSDFLVEISNQF